MNGEEWRPTADMSAVRLRADLLHQVRSYFKAAGVLEVETPLLGHGAPTDPHLGSLSLRSGTETLYLATSPEFHMKRLLASGCGPIYQISKAFRQGEQGRYHNQEFTMLEWYRPGWNYHRLMDEVDALMRELLDVPAAKRQRYGDLFESCTGLNPHRVSIAELENCITALPVSEHLAAPVEGLKRSLYLDLLMSHVVEPNLIDPVFLYEFPICQASLAAAGRDNEGNQVARRFEYYINGRELANGYQELNDAEEQARRFNADNQLRELMGADLVTIDQHLLAALATGLPDCAGVAIGFDRLLMAKAAVDSIDQVISFPTPVA